MTDWELILSMAGEKATTDITKARDSKGFLDCKKDANEGGQLANNFRRDLEKRQITQLCQKKIF